MSRLRRRRSVCPLRRRRGLVCLQGCGGPSTRGEAADGGGYGWSILKGGRGAGEGGIVEPHNPCSDGGGLLWAMEEEKHVMEAKVIPIIPDMMEVVPSIEEEKQVIEGEVCLTIPAEIKGVHSMSSNEEVEEEMMKVATTPSMRNEDMRKQMMEAISSREMDMRSVALSQHTSV